MLVCNVSLRPPRSAIMANIAEVATAVDSSTTGFVVFATLVDDPASVSETVDAYLGEIMLKTATASSTVDAGLLYAVAIVEEGAAIDTQNGILAVPGARGAMALGVFVNSGSSREANAGGIMLNL